MDLFFQFTCVLSFANTWRFGGILFNFFGPGPVRIGPKWPWDSQGPIFSPDHRFWTHFGPFLMFWARLENQGWAKTWLVAHLKIRAGPKLGSALPVRPADSRTFFWAPFRNLFLQVVRRIFRKFKNNVGPAAQHYLLHFQELQKTMLTNAQNKVMEWRPEKKFWNLQA